MPILNRKSSKSEGNRLRVNSLFLESSLLWKMPLIVKLGFNNKRVLPVFNKCWQPALKICWLPVLIQHWKLVLYQRSRSLSFRLSADSRKLLSNVGSTLVRLLISAWAYVKKSILISKRIFARLLRDILLIRIFLTELKIFYRIFLWEYYNWNFQTIRNLKNNNHWIWTKMNF